MHYFEVAADRAIGVYANEESIALYRKAISLTGTDAIAIAGQSPLTSTRLPAVAGLYEKLCSVLTLVDSFDEGRMAANEGIARLRAVDDMGATWLYLWLGEIEYQDNHFDAALAAYEAAETLVGPCGLDDDQERIDLWLSVQIFGKLQFYLLGQNDLERSASLIEALRPLVEVRGSKDFVAFFTLYSIGQRVLERRYRVDKRIVGEFRGAIDSLPTFMPHSGFLIRPESVWCLSMSHLGAVLTWYGDLDGARQVHEQALASARRQGSSGTMAGYWSTWRLQLCGRATSMPCSS